MHVWNSSAQEHEGCEFEASLGLASTQQGQVYQKRNSPLSLFRAPEDDVSVVQPRGQLMRRKRQKQMGWIPEDTHP